MPDNPRNFYTELSGVNTIYTPGNPNGISSVKPYRKTAYEWASDGKRHRPKGSYISPTAYSFVRDVVQEPAGDYYKYSSPNDWNRQSGYPDVVDGVSSLMVRFQQVNPFPTDFPSDLANKALIKARLKLKSSDFNAGVALGESRRTAQHIHNTVRRLCDLYKAFKRGEFKRVQDLLDEAVVGIPSSWLELQYGWKPLLSDIYGAAKSLEKDPASRRITTVKANSRLTLDLQGEILPGQDQANTCRAHVKGLHGSFVRIDVEPDSPGLITMASMGCTNPLSVAWELVPLSFVVDWFVPIGDFVSSLDALVGWKVVGFSQSNYTNWTARYEGKAGGATVKVNSWKAYQHRVRLSRTVSGSVPFPLIPSFKDPVTKSHMASALALLQQTFR